MSVQTPDVSPDIRCQSKHPTMSQTFVPCHRRPTLYPGSWQSIWTPHNPLNPAKSAENANSGPQAPLGPTGSIFPPAARDSSPRLGPWGPQGPHVCLGLGLGGGRWVQTFREPPGARPAPAARRPPPAHLASVGPREASLGPKGGPRGFPGVLRAAGTFSGQKRPLEGAGKNPIWPESNS